MAIFLVMIFRRKNENGCFFFLIDLGTLLKSSRGSKFDILFFGIPEENRDFMARKRAENSTAPPMFFRRFLFSTSVEIGGFHGVSASISAHFLKMLKIRNLAKNGLFRGTPIVHFLRVSRPENDDFFSDDFSSKK